MCGIVGVISKRKNGLFHSDMDIFSDLLFANQVRGAHGTGIMYNYEGKARSFKGAIPSSAILRDKQIDKVFNDIAQKADFVIGHNRHATKGAWTFENTHPFMEGDVALVHNGTLPHHKGLKDVEVDSHAICHSMNEIGEEATLEKIDGAFALVWYNNKTKTLNFIRNTERPLFIIETEYLWVISSEAKLAQWVLDRRSAFKVQEPKMCEVGQLYTYDIITNMLTSRAVTIKPKYISFANTKWFNDAGDFNSQAAADYYSGSATKDYSYKPPVVQPINPNLPRFIDVRVGDLVTFSPLDVLPHGRTFVLNGLAEEISSKVHQNQLGKDDELLIKLYNQDLDQLNSLMDHTLCKGEVMQIIYGKTGGKSKTVVLKDVKPVPLLPLPDKTLQPQVH